MALLLTVATGAWAQDPDPIDLTPSADASTVDLLTDADELYGSYVKYIAFTLVDAE